MYTRVMGQCVCTYGLHYSPSACPNNRLAGPKKHGNCHGLAVPRPLLHERLEFRVRRPPNQCTQFSKFKINLARVVWSNSFDNSTSPVHYSLFHMAPSNQEIAQQTSPFFVSLLSTKCYCQLCVNVARKWNLNFCWIFEFSCRHAFTEQN